MCNKSILYGILLAVYINIRRGKTEIKINNCEKCFANKTNLLLGLQKYISKFKRPFNQKNPSGYFKI